MNKKRIIWIELLRIAACIGVIGIHVASQHFKDAQLNSSVWAVSNFYHGINRFAVACFIMISGLLYLDERRTWNLKRLWTKNILQIAVAYIFWQMFYGVYRLIIKGTITQGKVACLKQLLNYVTKNYFHLWYLPMLMGLLAITPLIWEIVNSSNGKQWEEYMIILFLICQVIPYTVNYFPVPYRKQIVNILNTVHPDLVTSFTGYFILGHYLSKYGVSKKLEKIIYILGITFILSGITLCYYSSLKSGKPVQSFYENYTLAAFFWSTTIFLIFKNYVSRIRWNERQENVICILGNCTFGIYLIHAFFRNVLHTIGIDSMVIDNTVLAVPLVVLLIFVLSCAAVMLIKKIPVAGKWIV